MPALFRSQASLLIAMEPLRSMQGGAVHCHNWDSLINQHPGDIAACAAQAAELQRSDLACLIYTSGTGGAPRGVMQHHGAILHNIDGRSEEHTSELQSLMRISYAVFRLKTEKITHMRRN